MRRLAVLPVLSAATRLVTLFYLFNYIAETALGKQELSGLGVVFSNPALLNEPAYLVRVKPDKASINVYGKEKPLHIGMVVEADILHERKRLYEWILEPLYGIADKWQ